MAKEKDQVVKQENVGSAQNDLRDISVEKKLVVLFSLQKIHSKVDAIRLIRGELPLEVQDLEDETTGLKTRIANYEKDVEELEKAISSKKESIKNSNALITKYEEQQMGVRNNREYDSISKELEYQQLDIQLNEKKIKEHQRDLEVKNSAIEESRAALKDREQALKEKQSELGNIVKETEAEEVKLNKMLEKHEALVEDRLLQAYRRIRKNARNNLAVVKIERGACGGCFNNIPPQRQLDIKMHKKVIVCEYCGRILVDEIIEEMVLEAEPMLKE